MKKNIILIIVFSLLIMIIPVVILGITCSKGVLSPKYTLPKTIRLYSTNGSKIENLTPVEYLTGCLLAQINPEFEQEALKAQAIATNTLTLKLILEKPYSNQADLSDSSGDYQPYFSQSQAIKYYGDKYETYYKKAKAAAEFGVNYAITYENQLIFPSYHGISTGKTISAEELSMDYPYLKSVESSWDILCKNYGGSRQFTKNDVIEIAAAIDSNIVFGQKVENWFHDSVSSATGVVVSIGVGDKTFTGLQIWENFGIRSPAFTVSYIGGDIFEFQTKGYGNCLGLSQYGADYLAKQGENYEKILNYYYNSIKIQQISSQNKADE